ncbi:hypothetical protein FNF27_05035 [Cafeteria roenbergensis]|uniref:Amino acid transporter transmembrane domain-containing protein n=1 Tax=Cafeteria roenbergensis TaxID=33653 RepID=A0A5A8D8T3_CAFRO|nr:hypothetical protein FNF29_00660 [Cafeteria roenbergensis]KAA0159429.1 hypothetical protein FNF28_05872 [Cafeteria roenbergensis]KAA0161972.1 hypothetical protein FNF31_03549 [Cafeteria roenbergensis]KAA0173540.1 hypothetical protein FNF27_05035 [Cafeteria roenbergensis]|eukprot:KAA0157308.1 hypothetical protein FNF29_00660 [Cafeteria roenbergensis]
MPSASASSLNQSGKPAGGKGDDAAVPAGAAAGGEGSSFFGAVANLANAAVGAGVLAFPSAFRETGLVGGVVLTLLFAAIMGWTLHILGMASARSSQPSYQGVIRSLLGRWAGIVISASMCLYLFGSCVAYLDIVSNQITAVASSSGLDGTVLTSRPFVIGIVAVVMLPICLLPRIQALDYASAVAVLSIMYLEGDVIARSIGSIADGSAAMHTGGISLLSIDVGLFKALPVLAFALQCHLVYVPVFQSLKDKSLRNMDMVSVATYVLCCLLYLPTGIMGYLQFGLTTCSDIVAKNLPSAGDTDVARGSIALTAMLSFPLLHFVARTTLNDIIFQGTPFFPPPPPPTRTVADPLSMGDDASFSAMEPLTPSGLFHGEGSVADAAGAGGDAQPLAQTFPASAGARGFEADPSRSRGLTGRTRYLILTLGFIASAVGVAMAVSDLGVVMGVTGSTAAVVQVFLFPAALYLRIAAIDAGDKGPSWYSGAPTWGWVGFWVLVVFGVAMGSVSLAAVFMSADPPNCG